MPRREPERSCIVTRSVEAPGRLIRFVVAPDGSLVADLKARLPGRGAWVTARADHVRRALDKRLFARALKGEVAVSPTLPEDIDAALERDARQFLALANKAGNVVSGFAKVEAAIASGSVAALIHAADGAEDGRRKLAGALRKRLGGAISGVPVVTDFDGQDLDLAFGRSNVIHAALVAGAGSDGFLDRWRKLRFYRGLGNEQADLGAGIGDDTIGEGLQGRNPGQDLRDE